MSDKTPPRVTFSRSEKINTGNYTSKDIFVSISIDLDDDILAAARAANAAAPMLVDTLLAEIERQKKMLDVSVTEQPTSRFGTEPTKPTRKWGK